MNINFATTAAHHVRKGSGDEITYESMSMHFDVEGSDITGSTTTILTAIPPHTTVVAIDREGNTHSRVVPHVDRHEALIQNEPHHLSALIGSALVSLYSFGK